MIQLRLLNLDYKYDYDIDGSFEYEEFDEAMELIESILRR